MNLTVLKNNDLRPYIYCSGKITIFCGDTLYNRVAMYKNVYVSCESVSVKQMKILAKAFKLDFVKDSKINAVGLKGSINLSMSKFICKILRLNRNVLLKEIFNDFITLLEMGIDIHPALVIAHYVNPISSYYYLRNNDLMFHFRPREFYYKHSFDYISPNKCVNNKTLLNNINHNFGKGLSEPRKYFKDKFGVDFGPLGGPINNIFSGYMYTKTTKKGNYSFLLYPDRTDKVCCICTTNFDTLKFFKYLEKREYKKAARLLTK